MTASRLPLVGAGFGLAVALAFSTVARAEDFVAITANAMESYRERRMEDGKLKPESYVFMQGSFHPSFTRDRGLERMSFSNIALRLAQDLKAQAYFPAKKVAESDLLLVVHWGATNPRKSMDEMMARTGGERSQLISEYHSARSEQEAAMSTGVTPSDPFSLDGRVHAAAQAVDNEMLQMAHENADAEMGMAASARLLGLGTELQRENQKLWDSTEAHTLRSILAEERYFIVVVAYDCQELLKNKKLLRVWSTKMNIRSPGVNFSTALDRMSRVGGTLFGLKSDGLALEKAPDKTGVVEIGKLIVIESAADKK